MNQKRETEENGGRWKLRFINAENDEKEVDIREQRLEVKTNNKNKRGKLERGITNGKLEEIEIDRRKWRYRIMKITSQWRSRD